LTSSDRTFGLRLLPVGTGLLAAVTLLAAALSQWVPDSLARLDRFALAALVGFVTLLLLATSKFDVLVLLNFCLIGFVRTEPAPVDALSMALLLIGFLVGRLSLETLAGTTLLHLTVWGFLMTNLLALWHNASFGESLRYATITFYLVAFAYFVRLYLTNRQAIHVVLLGYSISVFLTCVLIGLGYLGAVDETLFVPEHRAAAFFKDPDVFGAFPVMMVLLLLNDVWHPRSHLIPGPSLVKVFGAVLCTVVIVLSFSRAAFINLTVSLAVYLALNLRELSPRRLGGLLGLAVVAMGALAGIVSQLGLEEFLWNRVALQPYDTDRFATHASGIEIGLTHLLGIGPGMFERAHSLYIRTFAEYGVFGALFLYSAIGLVVARVLRCAIRESGKSSGLLASVVGACLVGMLVNSLVIDTLHWRQFWFVWALAWGVADVAARMSPRDGFERSPVW
jgi:O-Antigen ligase